MGNISTRGDVLTGENVLIGGFIIGGATNKTNAIAATGPSLAAFGITNPLMNPTWQIVRQSDHAVIATNDDWQSDAAGFGKPASCCNGSRPHGPGRLPAAFGHAGKAQMSDN